jgi:hypothetical protein
MEINRNLKFFEIKLDIIDIDYKKYRNDDI